MHLIRLFPPNKLTKSIGYCRLDITHDQTTIDLIIHLNHMIRVCAVQKLNLCFTKLAQFATELMILLIRLFAGATVPNLIEHLNSIVQS